MKKYFVTGLVVLLPLALTFWIVAFILGLLSDPFYGIADAFLAHVGVTSTQIREVAGKLLALLFLFVLIIGIGAIGRYFFFNYLMDIGDAILHRIPLVGAVYKTSREFVQTLTTSGKSFKQVVLVPFPHKGSWTVGFLSRDDAEFEGRVAVFIPTAPNPTSGFLVLFAREEIRPLDMKVDEALRYVISCGVLLPQIKSMPKE
jgi:uncharacterized membrane protein